MYAYYGDVIWSNGREGGYLVLGNMVYTVSNSSQKAINPALRQNIFSMLWSRSALRLAW